MKGIITALLWEWSGQFDHNDQCKPEKVLRYNIGRQRFTFLQKYGEAFATKIENSEEYCAFLVQVDEDDLDFQMPQTTKYEYFCGKRTKENNFQVFSYIWFDDILSAKKYVEKHGMKILGGWNKN